MSVGEVSNVAIGSGDVAYFDPPYTKRQYAAYYHVLETIAYGDEPSVSGVTGLRPWIHNASDFCYKTRALGALQDLLARSGAATSFLSYSSDGHVALPALVERLGTLGKVSLHRLDEVGRYRPNLIAMGGEATVTEFLIEFSPEARTQVDRVA